jgi:hypothetical protein
MKLSPTGCAYLVALVVSMMMGNGAVAAEPGKGCDLRIGPCAPGATKPTPTPTPAGRYPGSGPDQGNRSHNGGGDKPHSTPSSGPVTSPLPNPLPDKAQ